MTFTYGGSLAPVRARNRTFPNWSIHYERLEHQQPKLVLVLGGTTGGLVEFLNEQGIHATLIELAEETSELKEWGDGHTIVAFAPSLLTELPKAAYDAVLLPGGTMHTGGPFWSDSSWATRRSGIVQACHDLVKPGGSLLLDAVETSDNLVRCVALGSGDRGTHVLESSIHWQGDQQFLVSSKTDYGLDGRTVSQSSTVHAWVPLPSAEAQNLSEHFPAISIAWVE